MKALYSVGVMGTLFLTACAKNPVLTSDVSAFPESSKAGSPATIPGGVTANKAPKNTIMPVAERKAQTETVSTWQLSGAIAARNAKKAYTASLHWAQQGPGSYQIRMSGPLGSGTVLVEKNGGIVTFRDGPKKASSTNADELLFKQTGVRLPVSSLYYWVRGIPAPGSLQAEKRDQYNHLTSLSQNGYVINYLGYTSVGKADLPNKMQLIGRGVAIKLVVKQWQI